MYIKFGKIALLSRNIENYRVLVYIYIENMLKILN